MTNHRSQHTICNRIIITPFHLPWDRPADYQRQTCFELAKQNTVVALACNEPISLVTFLKKIFSNETNFRIIHEVKTNYPIYWVSPVLILPGNRFRSIKAINWALSTKLFLVWLQIKQSAFNNTPILWIFDPIFAPLQKLLGSFTSVYDCVDYHQAATNEHANITQILENNLILDVDVFTVNSKALAQAHSTLRPPVEITVQGFANDVYASAPSPTTAATKPPVIGFLGAIGDRIDYSLLTALATKIPAIKIELFGPVEVGAETQQLNWNLKLQQLLTKPNVVLLAPQPKHLLWQTTNKWRVGLIPYIEQQSFNRFSFPMKLFEYFYMGVPVVSTALSELQSFMPHAITAKNTADFISKVSHLLKNPPSTEQQTQMRKLANAHSYTVKINSIYQKISSFEENRSK